jgi:hypothetical protein
MEIIETQQAPERFRSLLSLTRPASPDILVLRAGAKPA